MTSHMKKFEMEDHEKKIRASTTPAHIREMNMREDDEQSDGSICCICEDGESTENNQVKRCYRSGWLLTFPSHANVELRD